MKNNQPSTGPRSLDRSARRPIRAGKRRRRYPRTRCKRPGESSTAGAPNQALKQIRSLYVGLDHPPTGDKINRRKTRKENPGGELGGPEPPANQRSNAKELGASQQTRLLKSLENSDFNSKRNGNGSVSNTKRLRGTRATEMKWTIRILIHDESSSVASAPLSSPVLKRKKKSATQRRLANQIFSPDNPSGGRRPSQMTAEGRHFQLPQVPASPTGTKKRPPWVQRNLPASFFSGHELTNFWFSTVKGGGVSRSTRVRPRIR